MRLPLAVLLAVLLPVGLPVLLALLLLAVAGGQSFDPSCRSPGATTGRELVVNHAKITSN